VGFEADGVNLFYGLWSIESRLLNEGSELSVLLYRAIFSSFMVTIWLAWAATILALISTASIFPDFLSGGAIDLVLSKPIGRFKLFFFKYVTSLLFVLLQVAIFCFGLGVFACAPGLMLLFWNGMVVGPILALYFERGIGYDKVAWLSIHGVTELSAIVLGAAAGQVLGLAVLFPGTARRADALRAASPDAVRLVLLAALMLVVAAIIEGVFRQTVQDAEMRMASGWGAGALWAAWLLGAGR